MPPPRPPDDGSGSAEASAVEAVTPAVVRPPGAGALANKGVDGAATPVATAST